MYNNIIIMHISYLILFILLLCSCTILCILYLYKNFMTQNSQQVKIIYPSINDSIIYPTVNSNIIYPQNIAQENSSKEKPYLWLYWENINGNKTPDYIDLCYQTIMKHCSKSFNVVKLNESKIKQYLPELEFLNLDLTNLLIAQRVDFYRVFLLYKYGGLYIDADTLVLKDPIEIIQKLDNYDYVGFGCTGNQCNYGYGKPSNGIMASRPQGKLISRVLNNLLAKLNDKNKKWEYFDLGKLVIWDELDYLIKNENYQYYHYPNDYDGTRDINGNWIETSYLFSNTPIYYKDFNNMIFVILYNSQMKDLKNLTKDQILNSDTNIAKFFKKSLQ